MTASNTIAFPYQCLSRHRKLVVNHRKCCILPRTVRGLLMGPGNYILELTDGVSNDSVQPYSSEFLHTIHEEGSLWLSDYMVVQTRYCIELTTLKLLQNINFTTFQQPSFRTSVLISQSINRCKVIKHIHRQELCGFIHEVYLWLALHYFV